MNRLSKDLQCYIGQALCIDSNSLESAQEFLRNDPIIQSLAIGDDNENKDDIDVLENISIFRWRHLKDFSLRQDDGRFGLPTMVIGLRDSLSHTPLKPNKSKKKTAPKDPWLDRRQEYYEDHLKFLIESENVIQAGPLHACTYDKDDLESVPLGDLMIINAKDRAHAIEFAEENPLAKCGLYSILKVHRFNDLDVTGKFVADNQYLKLTGGKSLHLEMKEALEYWGYPVGDKQTKWLNR